MTRHRSPSGARTGYPESSTTLLRVVDLPGVHRLPPPPAASLRGRATVAAVAAGAMVAGAQTLVSAVFTEPPAPVGALLPVANIATASGATELTKPPKGIGGDQPLPDTLAVGVLDPGARLDIDNLTKAVDIGQELAKQANLLKAAMSDGADQARMFGDRIFVRPTTGNLTSAYGWRWGAPHQGIDVANAIGTPIYALTDGVVEEAGPAAGFGLWVVLRHNDGTRSVYGHINRMFVHEGQRVKVGEEIAEIGNRGESTGAHLHFEIWDAEGNKLNPVPYLQRRGIRF